MKIKCQICDGKGWFTGSYAGLDQRSPRKIVTQSRPCLNCKSEGSVDDGRPDYLEYDEYKQLLLAVLLSPGDDLPRLVLADWLEEGRYDPKRAADIRQKIDDWNTMTEPGHPGQEPEGQELMALREDGSFVKVVPVEGGYQDAGGRVIGWGIETRGFVGEVRLTLAAFVGRECEKCLGTGQYRSTYTVFGEHLTGPCYTCSSTGRIEGHAKSLFEAHPLTSVVITDAVIHESFGANYFFVGNLGSFPKEYWSRLDRLPSRLATRKALSEVCLDLGRSLANLDSIPAILSDGTPVSIPAGEAPSF